MSLQMFYFFCTLGKNVTGANSSNLSFFPLEGNLKSYQTVSITSVKSKLHLLPTAALQLCLLLVYTALRSHTFYIFPLTALKEALSIISIYLFPMASDALETLQCSPPVQTRTVACQALKLNKREMLWNRHTL